MRKNLPFFQTLADKNFTQKTWQYLFIQVVSCRSMIAEWFASILTRTEGAYRGKDGSPELRPQLVKAQRPELEGGMNHEQTHVKDVSRE